jgi:prepilin-type N-terminal cleavage/methylation domain-containing protein
MTSARHHWPRRDEAGVTLVELMIVLVMIAVGILALSAVQTRSSSDVYNTGRNTRALALAQSQMETVRAAGFTAAISDSGVSDGFNWWTRLTPLSTDLDQIDVTVTWTENGTQQALKLTNLLSDR